MAYPPGISLAVIQAGKAGTFFGDAASLTATVTPVLSGTKYLVHSATGDLMVPSPMTFTAANDSVLSFSVPHVDQAGYLDDNAQAYSMWAYKVDVTVLIGNGRQVKKHTWTKNFQPLVGQDFIDIDQIASGTISEGVTAPVAYVTDIEGQTGSVDISPIVDQGITDAINAGRIDATPDDAELAALINDAQSETGLAVSGIVSPLVQPLVPPLVADAIAADPTITNAAATAVDNEIAGRELISGEVVEPDVFRVQFKEDDGTLTAPVIEADEANGITSKVGGALLEPLDESTGFVWAIGYRDPVTGVTRADIGRRLDGSFYGIEVDSKPERAVIYGDSLIANWGATIDVLSAALGMPVAVKARGGQSSAQIFARQGGAPTRVTVAGNVIPATTAPVAVTMSTNLWTGAVVGGTSTGLVQGVPVTITVATDGTATLARTTAGTEIPAPPGSPFVTGMADRDAIQILEGGRNDYQADNAPADIVDRFRRALLWSQRPTEAIILNVPPWDTDTPGTTYRTKLDAVNAALLEAFPFQYVDWAGYLRSAAVLQSVGITPTATDLQNIADSVTPQSFRSDGGHFNAAAYKALAPFIASHVLARKAA